jgi:putative oxidoreductase
MSTTRNYVTWTLTVLAALVYLAAGYAKVSGQEMMVQGFTSYGLPNWFRITIGSLEIIAAILLLIPAFTGMASFGLSLIMIGALACHVMFPPMAAGIGPLVLLVVLTYIWMTRKNVVPVMLQKCMIG